MGVLVDQETRVLVQGITGAAGRFHAEQMDKYGTNVVAGVVPGNGGTDAAGVPVYDTITDAVRDRGPTAAVTFVPPAVAADALFEAIDAGLELVVAVTEGIPVQDMLSVRRRLADAETRLVGPNTPGVITPGAASVGILPTEIFTPGSVGVVSRSGTLTYEVVDELTDRGLGQSTAIGIGGDPVVGTSFVDALEVLDADPATRVIVLCGEIGGAGEQRAAAQLDSIETPVVGLVAGRTAPRRTRMGHAGAIVSGSGTESAASKRAALAAAGATVATTPAAVAEQAHTLR